MIKKIFTDECKFKKRSVLFSPADSTFYELRMFKFWKIWEVSCCYLRPCIILIVKEGVTLMQTDLQKYEGKASKIDDWMLLMDGILIFCNVKMVTKSKTSEQNLLISYEQDKLHYTKTVSIRSLKKSNSTKVWSETSIRLDVYTLKIRGYFESSKSHEKFIKSRRENSSKNS